MALCGTTYQMALCHCTDHTSNDTVSLYIRRHCATKSDVNSQVSLSFKRKLKTFYFKSVLSLRLKDSETCELTSLKTFYFKSGWRGGVTGKAFGLAISRSQVQILLGAMLRNNLRQVVYTCVPLSPSSITWYRPKGGDALRLGR